MQMVSTPKNLQRVCCTLLDLLENWTLAAVFSDIFLCAESNANVSDSNKYSGNLLLINCCKIKGFSYTTYSHFGNWTMVRSSKCFSCALCKIQNFSCYSELLENVTLFKVFSDDFFSINEISTIPTEKLFFVIDK